MEGRSTGEGPRAKWTLAVPRQLNMFPSPCKHDEYTLQADQSQHRKIRAWVRWLPEPCGSWPPSWVSDQGYPVWFCGIFLAYGWRTLGDIRLGIFMWPSPKGIMGTLVIGVNSLKTQITLVQVLTGITGHSGNFCQTYFAWPCLYYILETN